MASKSKELRLPSSRVKTIMKSSPEVENVSQDSLAVVTKATELFIQNLARQALERGKPNKVDYSDLAEVVQSDESLFFLKDIIPRKITVRQYKDLMKKEGISDEISSSSSEDTDDDSDVEVVEDESSAGEEEVSEDEDEDSEEDDDDVENEEEGEEDGEGEEEVEEVEEIQR